MACPLNAKTFIIFFIVVVSCLTCWKNGKKMSVTRTPRENSQSEEFLVTDAKCNVHSEIGISLTASINFYFVLCSGPIVSLWMLQMIFYPAVSLSLIVCVCVKRYIQCDKAKNKQKNKPNNPDSYYFMVIDINRFCWASSQCLLQYWCAISFGNEYRFVCIKRILLNVICHYKTAQHSALSKIQI